MEGKDRKEGEWFPKFTDANFLTYAPDDASREDRTWKPRWPNF
jgi:hypothetical protein